MLPTPRHAAIALAASLLAAAASAQSQNNGTNSMAVSETIDRTVELSPGADVSLESIAGPVTIETGNGPTAQVHIVRGAATARELACYQTKVDASASRLKIYHVQDKSRECNNIRSRQEVRLVLPRSANISMSSVAGNVEIAPTDGKLELSSIAGQVRAHGVRAADLSSIAGGLAMTLGQLDQRGVQVSSVVGATDLRFASGTNADVHVDSVVGSVTSATPAIAISYKSGSAVARVGSGGTPVNISSVVGNVTLQGN
ncbi:hypothetical protein [Sphingomonas alba]|uniref:Adhesin domain-containing protein n=1 Tax=Sphingomonas alba TaxID=2908208 RepID=A0ABT0RLB8_9SPHN|nr:hypothetical protein [Sphingomonas alba]MCL6683390.1 hypothetical protein [Sphingomonas alba]